MSLTAAAIRALAAKGLNADDIADIAEANEGGAEVSAAEKRKAYDRERKRAARLSGGKSGGICGQNETGMSAMSGGIPVESPVEIPGPRACGLDKPFKLVLSGSDDDVDETRESVQQPDDWPEGRLAEKLIEHAASQHLNQHRSPNLIGAANQILAWKRSKASWEHDVLPTVKAVASKSRTKISGWTYFDNAIAQSIADNRRALEIPEASPQRATGPPLDFGQRKAADDAEARRLAFERMDAANGR